MDIERAGKTVQSATGLIGILTGLAAAIVAFNDQLREAVAVFASLGVAGLVGVSLILCIVGAVMIANARRRGSRLVDPDALRLDSRNPEHLIGRAEDVRLLLEKCEARPLVFLVGESGSGKTALAQSGLAPAASGEGHLLPIYIDMAELDWEAGALAALANRLWHKLSADERKLLEADKPPRQDELAALLARCCQVLGKTLLLILDQIDDYQLRHRDRFFPPHTRSWIAVGELLPQNGFWALLAELLAGRHVHLLLITRSDNADGLESLRLHPEPLVVRLDPLPAGFVLRVLDQLTQRPDGAPPVIEDRERGWERLRTRLADDLERGGAVLPQQLKLALLGLARLKPLSIAGYERAGGIEGLEARYIEGALARASARAGIAVADLRAAVTRLLERDGCRRAAPLSTEELAGALPDQSAARLATAFEALEETDIVLRRESNGSVAWQLEHDYLARGILRAEANADRWKTLLVRRAQEFADASGDRRARRRARLSLREQIGILFARLAGRLRYGEQRGFALRCAVPHAAALGLCAVLVVAANGAFEMMRAEGALTMIAPSDVSYPPELQALGEIAQFGDFGRSYFAGRLLSDPKLLLSTGRKPHAIVRAMVGLDEAGAAELVDTVILPILEAGDPVAVRAAASIVAELPRSAQQLVLPHVGQSPGQDDGGRLEESIVAAYARRGPDEAAARSAVDALELLKAGRGKLGVKEEAMRANAARLYDAASAQIPVDEVSQMLFALQSELKANRGHPPAISILALLYSNVARRATPEARAQVVRDLIEEMRVHRSHTMLLSDLSMAEQLSARTLPPELGRQLAAPLLEELRFARHDPRAVMAVAMAVAATVPPLEPQRAEAAAIVLEQLEASRGAGLIVAYLAEVHAILTLDRPADRAARAAAFHATLDELANDWAQRGETSPFDRSPRGFFELCALGECFAMFASAVLDASAALPAEEQAAIVLDLLKIPVSGRLRLTETLLARLGAEPGAALAGLPEGDLWAFVAWAEARGLAPSRPLDFQRLLAALPQ